MDWYWYVVLCVIVLAICYVIFNYVRIKKMKEGTEEMADLAGIIRSGANQFIETEYKTIGIVVAVLAVVFTLFIEKLSGVTFLMGALVSSGACILGMARETKSIGETVKVALAGGSISGLSVQALGMLGLVIILLIWGVDHEADGGGFLLGLRCNPTTMRITTTTPSRAGDPTL